MIANLIKTILLALIILLALLTAAYAFNYFQFAETDFLKNKESALRTSVPWQIGFYLHVGFGGVALLLGGFQFVGTIRDRFTQWHRRCGVVYVISVFISSISGLLIALFADGGPIAKTGFALLALFWFSTNLKAYREIRIGRVLQHRSWMIRNYALTFAAVTLRIILPLELAVLGMNFIDAYRIVAWASWVPNLLVAELLVYRLTATLRPAEMTA
jgi:uncharacterized membrane protein